MGRCTSASTNQPLTHRILFGLFWILYVLSGIQPRDRYVWFFNGLVPVCFALLLFAFRKRYIPSLPTTWLLFLQGLLLLLGARFGFQNIPLLRVTLADGSVRSLMDWVTHFVDGLAFTAVLTELHGHNRRFRDGGRFFHWTRQKKGRFGIMVALFCFGVALLWEIMEWVVRILSLDHFMVNGGIRLDPLMDVGLTVLGCLAVLASSARRDHASPASAETGTGHQPRDEG